MRGPVHGVHQTTGDGALFGDLQIGPAIVAGVQQIVDGVLNVLCVGKRISLANEFGKEAFCTRRKKDTETKKS